MFLAFIHALLNRGLTLAYLSFCFYLVFLNPNVLIRVVSNREPVSETISFISSYTTEGFSNNLSSCISISII